MVQIQNNIKVQESNRKLLNEVADFNSVLWLNPSLLPIKSVKNLPLNKGDIYQANQLWKRFIPYLELTYPELEDSNGTIESPLKNINKMKEKLNEVFDTSINHLYLKCDHQLPIAGSIKARGGFYEVLHFAESLAVENGLISPGENYRKFASETFKKFFSQYTIGVGSTGNLGLSIGIISAKLGFNVSVYMSANAKRWKKDLLRKIGVQVHEFAGDFGEAISKGRKHTNETPQGYFIDDEASKYLFLGYSTAAFQLKKQLENKNIVISEKSPLFLYLPCGVGGSPGGVTFGVKQLLGDHVHCFFVEPTHSPSLLIGLATGKKENICVQDLGIDNKTDADGLAVGRTSTFATNYNELLVNGIYTIEDHQLFKLLTWLVDSEDIFVEPSATAGFLGPMNILKSSYLEERNINPDQVTHVVWSTGGALVPEYERKQFYKRGKASISK